MLKQERFYESVESQSYVDSDYILDNGAILELEIVGGNASHDPDTVVIISWDLGGESEKILLSTHGDTEQKTRETFTGNGSKILKIRLINNRETSQYLGGYWIGSL